MSDKVFLDTNVLIYLYSEDEQEKRARSRKIIDTDTAVISAQIINEFSNILIRKFKLDQDSIIKSIRELSEKLIVTALYPETTLKALSISKRFGYSYYDSLVIATSIENECAVLYSEDMQHSQKIDDVLTIINPFL